MTTVLLAGASGVFGRHISTLLTAQGYRVLGLGRGADNAVRADLNDREQLLHAVGGLHADVVVHAATALAKPPMRNKDMTGTDVLRTTGMHHLVEAAAEVGASKFIGENMVFGYGYGEHGATPLTEADAFGTAQPDPKLEAHVGAMREKDQLSRELGVSLRFGLFYGPGGTDALLPLLRRRMMPAPDSGGRVLPWINLVDAASAVLAAIEHGRTGEAYNIADDLPMSFGEQFIATAEAFGLPKPMRVPRWMMRPMDLLYAMLGTDLRVDSAKAKAELGWAPAYPTAAEGLKAMAR